MKLFCFEKPEIRQFIQNTERIAKFLFLNYQITSLFSIFNDTEKLVFSHLTLSLIVISSSDFSLVIRSSELNAVEQSCPNNFLKTLERKRVIKKKRETHLLSYIDRVSKTNKELLWKPHFIVSFVSTLLRLLIKLQNQKSINFIKSGTHHLGANSLRLQLSARIQMYLD